MSLNDVSSSLCVVYGDLMTRLRRQDLQHPHVDSAPPVQAPRNPGTTLWRSVRVGAGGPEPLRRRGHPDAVFKGRSQRGPEVRPPRQKNK